jgi:hypothetical protein
MSNAPTTASAYNYAIKLINASGSTVLQASDPPTVFVVPAVTTSLTYSIQGFRVGDRIVSASDLTATVADQISFSDGLWSLQFATNGQIVKLRFSGLSKSDDATLFSPQDLNLLFGENTIGLITAYDFRSSISNTSGQTLTGTTTADYLVGGLGKDRLNGLDSDDLLDGGGGQDMIYAGNGKDTLIGGTGNDVLIGGQGNDEMVGGIGVDTVFFTGKYVDYKVRQTTDYVEVIDSAFMRDDTDRLFSIERLKFSDTSLALDLDGNAGITVKILGAVFGKEFIHRKDYVGIGLNLLDSGMDYTSLAELAVNAALLSTNDKVVSTLWKNVIGTIASSEEKAPFISWLEKGMSPGTLAQFAAETNFNQVNIDLVGLLGTGIEYLPVT